jgi:zinc transporter ZupT
MLLGMLLVQYLSIFIIPGVMMAIAAASFIFVALSDFVIHLNEDKKGLAKTIIIVGAILGSLTAYSAEEFVHKIEDQNQKEVIYL